MLLLVMFSSFVVAFGTYYRMGNVDLCMGVVFVVGMVLGGVFGSLFVVDVLWGVFEVVFFFGMLFLFNRIFRSFRK